MVWRQEMLRIWYLGTCYWRFPGRSQEWGNEVQELDTDEEKKDQGVKQIPRGNLPTSWKKVWCCSFGWKSINNIGYVSKCSFYLWWSPRTRMNDVVPRSTCGWSPQKRVWIVLECNENMTIRECWNMSKVLRCKVWMALVERFIVWMRLAGLANQVFLLNMIR